MAADVNSISVNYLSIVNAFGDQKTLDKSSSNIGRSDPTQVHNFRRENAIRTTMNDDDGCLMVAFKGSGACAGFGKISTNIQGRCVERL